MVTGERQASRLGTGATRAPMLAIAVVDLVVAAMAWRALRTERAAAYEKAGQSVSDLARVLGENLEGTITRIDLALLASAHVLEEPGAMSGAARWRTEVAISRIAARLPIIDAIRATDADGTLVLGKDLKRDERVSVVDRDYFLAAKADPNARLSTSSPMIDRVSRRWSIAFARPYYRADGSFAGIVHAVVRTDTFTLTLGRVKAPYEGAVVLRGADNAAIARYPDLAHGESLIGQRKISPKLEEVVASRIAEATFPVQSPVEHQETLAAFRRIAGSPFYLLVTALSQSFLASWRMEAERTAIAVAVFVLLTFLAARLVLAGLRSEGERRFRSLVVEAPIAVAVVRGTRILYVNRAFLDAFGLPGAPSAQERALMDLVAPEEVARLTEHLDRRMRGLEAEATLELVALRPDGTRFRVVITDAVVALERGPAIVAFCQDVTEQRRIGEERERLVADLQRALGEVKTLSGLLPICAHCKKIRDDRGYWNRIEAYVRERSNAEFTHGICPECARALAEDEEPDGGRG